MATSKGSICSRRSTTKQWLDANNLKGQLFESAAPSSDSRATPNPADYQSWENDLTLDDHNPTLLTNVLDEENIPNVLNYMSIQAVTNSWDHFMDTNTFEYKDSQSGGTQRWSLFYWDMDSAFNGGAQQTFISPYDYGDLRADNTARFATTSLYSQPSLRSLYFRRLRTIVDKLYSSDQLLTKYRQITTQNASDMALDVAKWPYKDDQNTPRRSQADVEAVIEAVKQNFTAYFVQPWALPPAQTSADEHDVTINQAHTSLTPADEYIKLSNSSSQAVDISDWTLNEINYTIPAGSVIPAHGDIYLLKDSADFTTANPGDLVAGQYDTSLSTGTHLTLRTDSGEVIDNLDY
jgi:hypothetical protein